MHSKISDSLRFVTGAAVADLTAAPTTAYTAASDARRVLALVQTAALAAARTITVQFLQATTAGGAGSKALGAAIVYTHVGAAAAVTTAEVKAEDLDTANGYGFIAAQVTLSAGAAIVGAVSLVKGDLRYATAA